MVFLLKCVSLLLNTTLKFVNFSNSQINIDIAQLLEYNFCKILYKDKL